jgi:hypothetical protein
MKTNIIFDHLKYKISDKITPHSNTRLNARASLRGYCRHLNLGPSG